MYMSKQGTHLTYSDPKLHDYQSPSLASWIVHQKKLLGREGDGSSSGTTDSKGRNTDIHESQIEDKYSLLCIINQRTRK